MIPIFDPLLGEQERAYLLDCIDSGWISSQGRYITRFEEEFAAYCQVPHAVAAGNCTVALHLALAALGIGPGDEVLCPDLTFIAPANMIRVAGATPVLVDVDPVSWGIDPQAMAGAITPRTKAVIVVHPFGHAADMDPIMELARRHGLKVIEDVAEAPGALYKGRILGGIGDAGCFSFFANKIMTTGEGGMVTCRDPVLDKQLRIYRDHGMSREQKYVHVVVGFNYRMTSMQAAVGCAQLERMPDIQSRRDRQAALYAECFAGSDRVQWRPAASWCRPVHWLSTVSLRHRDLRAPLMDHLRSVGIEPRPMIFPVHEAEPFHGLADPALFPVSTDISHRSVHLPSSTMLADDQIRRIANEVLEWLARNDR